MLHSARFKTEAGGPVDAHINLGGLMLVNLSMRCLSKGVILTQIGELARSPHSAVSNALHLRHWTCNGGKEMRCHVCTGPHQALLLLLGDTHMDLPVSIDGVAIASVSTTVRSSVVTAAGAAAGPGSLSFPTPATPGDARMSGECAGGGGCVCVGVCVCMCAGGGVCVGGVWGSKGKGRANVRLCSVLIRR